MDAIAIAETQDDGLIGNPNPLQRVALVFASPTRAFQGAGLASSWWLPFVLIALVSFGFLAIVGSRVGWDTVARNTMAASPKQEARLQMLPPEQQQTQLSMVARITKVTAYAVPPIGVLLIAAIVAGILLATLNFGFGGHAGYAPLFAVYLFSALPQLFKSVLGALLLLFGVGTDTFLLSDPFGSNLAYYLRGGSTPYWMLALLRWFDVFTIWQIVVLILGCAVVAKLSRGKAAAAVVIWTVLLMLGSTAFAAISG